MKLNVFLFFLFISMFSFQSCKEKSSTKTLKLAHGLNIEHPVHIGMEFMAKALEEISGGKMGLEIYPSQQLGSERQCLELLQIGSLAMTKVSAAVIENFSPRLQVVSLPYIFRDREHIYKFQDSDLGKQLLVEGSEYWLRGLIYFDAGQRSFYTKTRPVNNPDDLKGLKIRVQESKTAMDLVRSMGGAPTPISWGELYTALQQGIVDGAENNPPSFLTSRHYEVCKYYTLNEHTAVPDLLVISTIIWDKLSPQEQKWVQQAADEAKIFQRKVWVEAEEEALEFVKSKGVEIIRPDKTLFAQKTKNIQEEYKNLPDLYNLIERIKNIN
jgi:tripartite ATP-independent transporter DctP family solute receptor